MICMTSGTVISCPEYQHLLVQFIYTKLPATSPLVFILVTRLIAEVSQYLYVSFGILHGTIILECILSIKERLGPLDSNKEWFICYWHFMSIVSNTAATYPGRPSAPSSAILYPPSSCSSSSFWKAFLCVVIVEVSKDVFLIPQVAQLLIRWK